jgi:phosphatidate cytidylyltransferase
VIRIGGSELRKRVITGVAGGALLLLLVIFGGAFGIFAVTTIISLGMVYEFAEITLGLPDRVEKRYALLCTAWFVALANLLAPSHGFELAILVFLGLFTYWLFTATRHDGPSFLRHFQELMYSIFGLVYLAFAPLFLTRLHGLGAGVKWTILFLLICWAGDTGAYFTGRKFGRQKLYAKISPKKTVEGAIGGLLLGVVVGIVFKLLVFRELSWFSAIAIPLVVGAVSQVGDLCESFLKRAFDKKDSGSILPGHGGFLDRFDGVVFSAPVMYALTRIL